MFCAKVTAALFVLCCVGPTVHVQPVVWMNSSHLQYQNPNFVIKKLSYDLVVTKTPLRKWLPCSNVAVNFPITLTSIRKPIRILYLYWFNIGGKFTAYSCLFCYSLVNPLYLLTDCNTILVGVCMYACMHGCMCTSTYAWLCTSTYARVRGKKNFNLFTFVPMTSVWHQFHFHPNTQQVWWHVICEDLTIYSGDSLDSSYVLPDKDSPRKG